MELVEQNIKMKSMLRWFFDYADEDEADTVIFPNVVISIPKIEFEEMKEIIN